MGRKTFRHPDAWASTSQCSSLHQPCHNESRAGDMNTVGILLLSVRVANSARFDLHGQCPVPCRNDVINDRQGTDGAP